MRIAIGQLAHETNTFSTVKTSVELFKQWEWEHGEAILQKHTGVKDFLGGMIDRGKEKEVEIVPTFSAMAMPSGVITKGAYETIKHELLSAIKTAGYLDAICLFLHGAGVTEEHDDLEGELLKSLRKEIEYQVPIVVVLDLHANISETMIKEADAILGNIEYPHVDSYERGIEAIDLALDIIHGRLEPKMHVLKLPMFIPTTTSYHSPIKEINEWCKEYENHPEVIDCTFYHGFPYADIPFVGVSIITITSNNPDLARIISQNIANKVWELKEEFFPTLPSPKEALQEAAKLNIGPIILNETSDNPGGGTPGDGTHLLSEMISLNIPNSCFGFIYDPEVADKAHESGIGSIIQINLGGKTDSLHGEPLKVEAYVKCLTDGQFIQSSPMWHGSKVNLGKSVRVQIGNVDVIVCSVRSQTFDEEIFQLHGINVLKSSIVGLKSSHHFRAAFESIAKKIITVDSPGLSTGKLQSFIYKNRPPLYPLDEVTFTTLIDSTHETEGSEKYV